MLNTSIYINSIMWYGLREKLNNDKLQNLALGVFDFNIKYSFQILKVNLGGITLLWEN